MLTTRASLCILAFLVTAIMSITAVGNENGSISLRSPLLLRVQNEIAGVFTRMDAYATVSAKKLSQIGLTGPRARKVLSNLCEAIHYALYCSAVDLKGIRVTVEPEEYKNYEGTDISDQKHIIEMHKSWKPILSQALKAAGGLNNVVDIEYPVYGKDGKPIGSVSLIFRPNIMLEEIITKATRDLPVDIWVMQLDGLIIYDADEEEIGNNCFTDPLYQSFPELVELGKRIARERAGSGMYEFLGTGLEEAVKKEAIWTTVGLYGTQWRLILTHELPADYKARRLASEEVDLTSLEDGLRSLSRNPDLASAITSGNRKRVLSFFKAFYDFNPGLYSIQWIDRDAVIRYGYPSEYSLENYNVKEGRIQGKREFLNAIENQKEKSFNLDLIEGRRGHFFVSPMFHGGKYIGSLYIVILQP